MNNNPGNAFAIIAVLLLMFLGPAACSAWMNSAQPQYTEVR